MNFSITILKKYSISKCLLFIIDSNLNSSLNFSITILKKYLTSKYLLFIIDSTSVFFKKYFNYLAILSARVWCKFEEIWAGGGGVGKGNKLGMVGCSRLDISCGTGLLTGKLIPSAANADLEAPNLALFLLDPIHYNEFIKYWMLNWW